MNLLAIVQALHYEAKLTGSAPDSAVAQTGRDADLVRWSIEAWNDIQRDKDGKWKWMLSDWTVDTVSPDGSTLTFTALLTTGGEFTAATGFSVASSDFSDGTGREWVFTDVGVNLDTITLQGFGGAAPPASQVHGGQ